MVQRPLMVRTAIGVVCVVLLTACAKGATSGSGAVAPQAASAVQRGCQAIDTSFALGTPVFTECGVDRKALERGRRPTPEFSPRPPVRECYNVVVAVVIDERGMPVPATARVVRSNDSHFTQAVLNTIPAWRFTPAEKDGLPVKQVVEIGLMVATRVVRSDRPMSPPLSAPRC